MQLGVKAFNTMKIWILGSLHETAILYTLKNRPVVKGQQPKQPLQLAQLSKKALHRFLDATTPNYMHNYYLCTGCTMVGDYYYTDEHLGGGGGKANPLFLSLYHEPLIKTTRTKYKIIHQHIFNYNNNYSYIIYLYQEYINEKTKGWSMQLLQKIIKKQNRIELLCLKYFTIPIRP